jgi:hypothetical protein
VRGCLQFLDANVLKFYHGFVVVVLEADITFAGTFPSFCAKKLKFLNGEVDSMRAADPRMVGATINGPDLGFRDYCARASEGRWPLIMKTLIFSRPGSDR